MLNVSFLVPQMRREFGGCAGNIAFNLSCSAMSACRWRPWARISRPTPSGWTRTAVPRDHVKVIAAEHTAQALHHHRPRR
jgi:adenosine kinase